MGEATRDRDPPREGSSTARGSGTKPEFCKWTRGRGHENRVLYMGQAHAGTGIESCKEFDRELAPNPSFASGQAFYAVAEPDSGATRGTLQLQNEVLVPA